MFSVPVPAPTEVTPGIATGGSKPSPLGNVVFKLTDGTNVETFPLMPDPSVSRLVIPGARKTASNPSPGAPRPRSTDHRGAVGESGFQ